MRTYRKTEPMHYAVPRHIRKHKIAGKRKTAKGFAAHKPSQKPSIVANVMDVAYFLSRYLSGEQNISMSAAPGASFSTSLGKGQKDKTTWQVIVPSWRDFKVPVKDDFSRYRIFRHGVYHESMHVAHTPPQLFNPKGGPLIQDLVNIIEDRRIEDLGQEEWPGYKPERIFTKAWAYAVRPDVSKIPDRNTAVHEAFLQKLLIGRVKGGLQKEEMDKVDSAVKHVLGKLKKLKGKSQKRIVGEVINLAFDVERILDLNPSWQPNKWGTSNSTWDDTFNPDWVRRNVSDEEQVSQDMDKYFEEAEDEAKKRKPGEEVPPDAVTKDDVKQAQKGSVDVSSEYQTITMKKSTPPELGRWQKVATFGSPSDYRDSRFITRMQTHLRHWRKGYVEVRGESGARLSIPQYIRKKEEPFVTRLKMSAKGRKILMLADFSGSMMHREEDYKKALISSMEVLDNIGTKTAFFSFGVDPAQGEGFFVVKSFEEPRWTNRHSARIAGLRADGSYTPTDDAYKMLSDYIRKHRPEVTVTVTDGAPQDIRETSRMISLLKKHTKMVAFGIGNEHNRTVMDNSLKTQGYTKHFTVTNVYDIPPRLVKLIAPT